MSAGVQGPPHPTSGVQRHRKIIGDAVEAMRTGADRESTVVLPEGLDRRLIASLPLGTQTRRRAMNADPHVPASRHRALAEGDDQLTISTCGLAYGVGQRELSKLLPILDGFLGEYP